MATNKVIATLPENIRKNLSTGDGVILTEFDPVTFDVAAEDAEAELRSNILFATSGGVSVSASYETVDLADGIDNAVTGLKELVEIDRWTVELSGTAISFTAESITSQLGAADMITDESSLITVTPRTDINANDFKTLWYLTKYGNTNGWIAIKLDNMLSSSFAFQSAGKDKSNSSFTYTAYSSIEDIHKVPITYYIKPSSDVATTSGTANTDNGGQTPAQEPEEE